MLSPVLSAAKAVDERHGRREPASLGLLHGFNDLRARHVLVDLFKDHVAAGLRADVDDREACLFERPKLILGLSQNVARVAVDADPLALRERSRECVEDLEQLVGRKAQRIAVAQEDPPHPRVIRAGIGDILHDILFGLDSEFLIFEHPAERAAVVGAPVGHLQQEAVRFTRGSVNVAFQHEICLLVVESLHALGRFDAQQMQAVADDLSRRCNQRDLGDSLVRILHQDVLIVVEAVERARDLDDVTRDDGRFVFAARLFDDGRHAVDQLHEIIRAVAGDLRCVDAACEGFLDVRRIRLAQDAARTRMRVLDVGACLAVEVEHAVPVEDVVLDAVVGQFVEDDRADADLVCDLGDDFLVDAFFTHDLGGLLDRLVEDVLQEDDLSLTGGHRHTAGQADQTERDVDAVVRPVVAHQVEHAEPLLEVQVLLAGDDVDVLVEVVGFLAVHSGCDVAGDVQRGAVALLDQCGRHIVVVEADDLGALGLLEQALVLHFLDESFHLIGVETLAVVAVELDAEHLVDAAELLERFLAEPLPQPDFLLAAVLELGKDRTGFVVQRRILLRLFMELRVVTEERLDRLALDVFLVAPVAVGADHLAELRPVIAEVVDADRVVAECVVDLVDRVANDGAADVSDVERLGDVGRAILDNNRLMATNVTFPEIILLCQHFVHHVRSHLGAAQEHVDVGVDLHDFVDNALGIALHAGVQLFCDVRCDHRRRLSQNLRQAEARQRVIAHALILRNFDQVHQFFFGQFNAGRNQLICGFLFVVDHLFLLFVSEMVTVFFCVDRDPVRFQQRCEDAVAGRQRMGECPVIDLPAPAGRAVRLQDRPFDDAVRHVGRA